VSVVPGDWLTRGLGQTERELRANGASEFSHGPGLVAPGLEDTSPANGGRYHGLTPPIKPDIRMNRGTAGKPGGPRVRGVAPRKAADGNQETEASAGPLRPPGAGQGHDQGRSPRQEHRASAKKR
jgi:hypothetical protein